MYELSDEQGNRFVVESKELACKIVNEKDNPFINMVRISRKVPSEHIIKSYADFCVYFY